MEMRSVFMEITPQVAVLQELPLMSTISTVLPPGGASPEEEEDLQTQSPGMECISRAGLDETENPNLQLCSLGKTGGNPTHVGLL